MPGSEVVIPAACLIDRAILLTYGCEIDKDKRHRLVALVRPMIGFQESEKETIRANGKYACFHLPAMNGHVEEGYVDFRRLSTVSPDWLEKNKRVTTLAEHARRKLLLRFFLFMSRLQLEDSIFDSARADEA